MTIASRLSSPHVALRRADGQAVEWRVSDGLTTYDDAVAAMEARVAAIAANEAPELVWLLEHPPLYTAGTGADEDADVAGTLPFPLYRTGRGGQVTYHGPGQRVVYVCLDLQKRAPDVRAFVIALERWIVATLATFGIEGESRADRVGVWVARPDKPRGLDGAPAEDKIAAIGIRVRRWVTFHGISLNVAPELAHFGAITPCGISARHLGVTSLADLGRVVSLSEVDTALAVGFEARFGPVVPSKSL